MTVNIIKELLENRMRVVLNRLSLDDRIKVKAGEKLKFGTQLSYDSTGCPFHAIRHIDSTNVEKLRKAYGLES